MNEQEYEFQVEIDDIIYQMNTLVSARVEQPLFDKFDVGLACSAMFEVRYRTDVLPQLEPSRGAKLVPMCRPKGTNDSWIQLGVFYIDLRTEKNHVKTLTCYDSMMFSDIPFLKDGDVGEWPRKMPVVAGQISDMIGVPLDARNVFNQSYSIDYPNDSTARELLEYIASAHAGNWIITRQNTLLLVPIFSAMPNETHYLVTEYGAAIVFGEDRILV